MTISFLETQNGATAELAGRLDTLATTDLADDFQRLNTYAGKEVVLDLSHLEYISSSGLRMFIQLRKEAAAKGGKIIIKNMNNVIRNVFTMTGFISLFEIVD